MDNRTFDSLTRAMATGTSRRTVFARVIAGIAGATLALQGATTQATSDCADFCRALPPGQRGSVRI